MSLKINNTTVFGICYSAEDWARNAIGAEKRVGPEGFENFSSGGWHHYWHYKDIDRTYPWRSNKNTLEEMSQYRERLAEEIISLGKHLDERIMRLAKMEEQMKEVIENNENN